MTKTPREFFRENMKWLALMFFCLFMLKSTQSCTRNMSASIKDKKTNYIIDSLTKRVNILERKKRDTINYFQSELKVANIKVISAEKNIEDVKEVAKRSTIINNIQKNDSTRRK